MMPEYIDLMIPLSRAVPKDGTEVIARVGEHITNLEYNKGFPVPGVKSWVWLPKVKCSCHKLRWGGTKSGTCNKCGTKWRKVA